MLRLQCSALDKHLYGSLSTADRSAPLIAISGGWDAVHTIERQAGGAAIVITAESTCLPVKKKLLLN